MSGMVVVVGQAQAMVKYGHPLSGQISQSQQAPLTFARSCVSLPNFVSWRSSWAGRLLSSNSHVLPTCFFPYFIGYSMSLGVFRALNLREFKDNVLSVGV